MNVYDSVHSLAKALQESEEYKQYLEAKEKLEEDEKAKEMLVDFRNYQLQIQKEQQEGNKVTKEKGERLKNMYEAINNNLTVKNYLSAEYRFGKMMADISKIIGEAVGIEEFEEITGTSEKKP